MSFGNAVVAIPQYYLNARDNDAGRSDKVVRIIIGQGIIGVDQQQTTNNGSGDNIAVIDGTEGVCEVREKVSEN